MAHLGGPDLRARFCLQRCLPLLFDLLPFRFPGFVLLGFVPRETCRLHVWDFVLRVPGTMVS